MGWLQRSRHQSKDSSATAFTTDPKPRGDRDDGDNKATRQREYEFQNESVRDEDLPFIDKSKVESKRLPKIIVGAKSGADYIGRDLWIVVDDTVYDCTDFIADHPGGEQTIASFVGEDCSWQFWRFHGKDEMEQYGRVLRIGRTEGASIRFQEPAKYIGLVTLGNSIA